VARSAVRNFDLGRAGGGLLSVTTTQRIAPELNALAIPLERLDSLPGNPRKGDVDAVARSYSTFGQRKPIVARRNGDRGIVIAGNHQLAAARQLGWSEIAVVWTDDDDETAAAFALADNRTAELGGYDDEALAAMISSVEDAELLAATGWSEDAIEELMASLDPEQLPPALSDPDDVPDPPKDPVSAFGDLWLLGPHRLLCGDSTNPDHLALVTDEVEPGIVYTDPPYGIAIVNDSGKVGHAVGTPFGGGKVGKVIPTTKYLPVAGDDTTDVARDAFTLLMASYPKAAHVWWGGNHFAASASLPDSPCWLVWDKETGDNTFADAELAWTNHDGAVRVLRHMWNGMLRATERGKRVHPTQKPVALAEWAFGVVDKDASRRTVLDVFGGSGSTLIAAHQTQRTAYVIEMEPSYADVICRRYQEHTGTKPTRDGVPHDFTGG
jgi:16S rRNA G966 N2-methylase RsmD